MAANIGSPRNLLQMAANNGSPRSPLLNEQRPNNQRLGIEIPLGFPQHIPQQEINPSPVAPDEDNDFFGLYYRVDVEALDEWATVTSFMRGSIGYVVQEPEVTDDSKQFLITMYGSNWEKRVFSYQTMIFEQLYALMTGYSKLTWRIKRASLAQFDSWNSSQLRALKLRGSLSPEVSLRSGKLSGIMVGGAGLTCVTIIFCFCSSAALK